MVSLLTLPFRLVFGILFGLIALPFALLALPLALLYLPFLLLRVLLKGIVGLVLLPFVLVAAVIAAFVAVAAIVLQASELVLLKSSDKGQGLVDAMFSRLVEGAPFNIRIVNLRHWQ